MLIPKVGNVYMWSNESIVHFKDHYAYFIVTKHKREGIYAGYVFKTNFLVEHSFQEFSKLDFQKYVTLVESKI